MDSGNETLFSEDSSPDSAPPPSPSSGRGSQQPTPAPTPPHITSSLSKVNTHVIIYICSLLIPAPLRTYVHVVLFCSNPFHPIKYCVGLKRRRAVMLSEIKNEQKKTTQQLYVYRVTIIYNVLEFNMLTI